MPRECGVFDPADGFAPLVDPIDATDATILPRGTRWWMCVASDVARRPGIHLATASLPDGVPRSPSDWRLTADAADPSRIAVLPPERSAPWDLTGGRRCPSYVKGSIRTAGVGSSASTTPAPPSSSGGRTRSDVSSGTARAGSTSRCRHSRPPSRRNGAASTSRT